MDIIRKLKPLEEVSLSRKIPIIGPDKGSWLASKVKELQPKHVLELGTANGYSGIILGSEGAEVTTIDINKEIVSEAEKNFKEFKIKAQLIVGDGVTIVKELAKRKKEYFDLIYIDFAKAKYKPVLDDCISMLKHNGYIIADNITMDGCKDFKEAVLHNSKLKTEIIHILDGLSCSRKM